MFSALYWLGESRILSIIMGRKKRGSTAMSKPDMTLGNQQALNNRLIKIETKYFHESASINCNGKRTSSHQPLCQGRECSAIDCSWNELHTDTSLVVASRPLLFPNIFLKLFCLWVFVWALKLLFSWKIKIWKKFRFKYIWRCHSRNRSNRSKHHHVLHYHLIFEPSTSVVKNATKLSGGHLMWYILMLYKNWRPITTYTTVAFSVFVFYLF